MGSGAQRLSRRVTLVLAVGVVVVAACSPGEKDRTTDDAAASTTTESTVTVSALQAKASRLTDRLIAGRYTDVVATFNAEMRSGLTAEGLKTAWEQVVAAVGAYKSRGTTARVNPPSGAGFLVFDTPMTFGTQAMKSRITFETDGAVAGFFILYADVR